MGRTRNDSAEFVGLETLKARHSQQLESFEQWASERDWTAFHSSHYDWWMFPYGCHSGAYGAAYAIYEHEAEILKQDKEFIKRFLRGVELLMLSWGWDLYGKCEIDNPDPDQCWQDWPIRLYKCAKSLKLFGFEEEFKSVREYAIPFYNTEGRPEIHLIGIWKETALYHKKQLKTTCYDNHNLFNHSGLHNLRKRC